MPAALKMLEDLMKKCYTCSDKSDKSNSCACKKESGMVFINYGIVYKKKKIVKIARKNTLLR